jgi:hypothetical protein
MNRVEYPIMLINEFYYYQRQIFDHFRLWEGQSLFTHEQLDGYVKCFEKAERAERAERAISTTKDEVISVTTVISKDTYESPTIKQIIKSDPPIKRTGFCPIGQKASVDTTTTPTITTSTSTSTSQSSNPVNNNNNNNQDDDDNEDLDGEAWTATVNESELDGEPMPSDKIEADDEQLDGEPLDNDDEEEEEDLDGVAMEDTPVTDLSSELTDKLERYRASLSALPQMAMEKQETLLEEFRKKLLSNEETSSSELLSTKTKTPTEQVRQEGQSVVVTVTQSSHNANEKEQQMKEEEEEFDMFA